MTRPHDIHTVMMLKFFIKSVHHFFIYLISFSNISIVYFQDVIHLIQVIYNLFPKWSMIFNKIKTFCECKINHIFHFLQRINLIKLIVSIFKDSVVRNNIVIFS